MTATNDPAYTKPSFCLFALVSEGPSMDGVNLRIARTSDSWITQFTL